MRKPEPNTLIEGDCLEVTSGWPDDVADLIVCSPPYENAREYGELKFSLRGDDWVAWMLERVTQFVRVCKGLVVVVCWGRTRDRAYSGVPEKLTADAMRAGLTMWRPVVFHRVGIAGSGGDQGLRSDWEFCLMFKPPGKLPWSDNTACGHPPKWAPGGAMSHRLTDGTRRNQWGASSRSTGGERHRDGKLRVAKPKPSHCFSTKREHTKRRADGQMEVQHYTPPAIANPGDFIVIDLTVGGGHMGHPLAHDNEAPFPLKLPEFFIQSYCPPGGTVCDPFCGSGTTLHAAEIHGRRWIGIDARQSQIDLSRRRLDDVRRNHGALLTASTKPADREGCSEV